MELNNTFNIRGIFVWMIFFRHCTSYYNRNNGKTSIIIDVSLQQNIVSLFLFYSGYGIYKSFEQKGIEYIKTLPIKSLIIFIKSQLILLIFLINNKILGDKISLKHYLYAVIFKKSIGNSYWFVFTIITLYIHSFISFILIRNKKFNFIGIIFITIICYYHAKYVYKYYHPNEIISVDNIICFVIGFYYSFLNPYIDKIIMFNDIIYFISTSTFAYFYYIFYKHPNRANVYYISLKNLFFTLLTVVLTMKIKFNNDFLKFLNSHSYSIYLIQRIPMIFIAKKGIFRDNLFIGFFFEFSVVVTMACIFDKFTKFIDTFIYKCFCIGINSKKNYSSIKTFKKMKTSNQTHSKYLFFK
jgi:hypothetical protein